MPSEIIISAHYTAQLWLQSLLAAFDSGDTRTAVIDYMLSGGSGAAASTNKGRSVYNILNSDYGGNNDGTTENDTALAAIFSEIGSGTDENAYGGVIHLPPGDFYFDDPILPSDRSQIEIIGCGSSVNAENKKGVTRIIYGGTEDYFIKQEESGAGQGEARHLTIRNCDIVHRNTGFTGRLVHLNAVRTVIDNCRFGYDYFNDSTHRYLATGIYVENGKQIAITNCSFDHLTHGYHAPSQVIQKNKFSIVGCDFNVCTDYAILHEDTNTGHFFLADNTFNPVRQAPGGPAENGVRIIANGYTVLGNSFQGSQSGEMYSDTACYLQGRGAMLGNLIVGGPSCTGVELSGGVCLMAGNHIVAGRPLYMSSGDLIVKGSPNYYAPSTPDTGTDIDLSFSGSTVTLTDSGANFAAGLVDKLITISGATNAGNDGTFAITAVPSSTTLQWENASGVTESGVADYSIGSKTAVTIGKSGNVGSLNVDIGPDRIETSGAAAFKHSYEVWDNSAVSGKVQLPTANHDESTDGPNWTGVNHELVFEGNGKGWKNLTSDYTLTPYDNGRTFTNYGASGGITVDIPDGAQWNGFECYFITVESYEISIEPQGSTDLYVGGGAKTDLYTSTRGNQVAIRCGPSGDRWFGDNYGGWSTTP